MSTSIGESMSKDKRPIWLRVVGHTLVSGVALAFVWQAVSYQGVPVGARVGLGVLASSLGAFANWVVWRKM